MRVLVGVIFLLVCTFGNTARAADGWNGFYVGGHFGYGWVDVERHGVNLVTGVVAGPQPPFQPRGIYGGIHGGYNYVTALNILVGVEADFSLADIRFYELRSFFNPAGALVSQNSARHRTDYFGTVRARLGYVHEDFLFYFTGGWIWRHRALDITRIVGTLNFATPGTVEEMRAIFYGWTVGGGIERRLSRNWTARFEYHYLESPFEFVTPLSRIFNMGVYRRQELRVGMTYLFE